MPLLRIRTRNINLDEWVSTQVFNYPDSSILSYILETRHMGLTEPVKIYKKGEDLWVVSSR